MSEQVLVVVLMLACRVVLCRVELSGVVLCCAVLRLCCDVLCWDAPKVLLPEGNGRDVYPQVQVNGRPVCIACVLCASVWIWAERGE